MVVLLTGSARCRLEPQDIWKTAEMVAGKEIALGSGVKQQGRAGTGQTTDAGLAQDRHWLLLTTRGRGMTEARWRERATLSRRDSQGFVSPNFPKWLNLFKLLNLVLNPPKSLGLGGLVGWWARSRSTKAESGDSCFRCHQRRARLLVWRAPTASPPVFADGPRPARLFGYLTHFDQLRIVATLIAVPRQAAPHTCSGGRPVWHQPWYTQYLRVVCRTGWA